MARMMRTVAVSMAMESRRPAARKENLDYIAGIAAAAAPLHPDVVCLPEVFPLACLATDAKEWYAPDDAAFLRRLAKKHRCNIVGSVYEERKGRLYNTALWVDRRGEVAGRYDKIHPTESEIEKGVTPGSPLQPPIGTEFGPMGVQICFDANWPEDWERLARAGVPAVFFSSAFPGGTILSAIATLSKVCVVPAIWSLDSGVIDNTGRWVVRTDRFAPWVWADVNLERTVYHWDFQETVTRDIARKYGDRVKIETFGPEAWFVLSPGPGVSLERIEREFSLVRHRDYIARAARAADRARPRPRKKGTG